MDGTVSIITPIYNMEVFVPRCIESLINQTYQNIEILLVDDGSKDNSGKICDEYALRDERIRVIHQENQGIAGAINTGLDNATGDYITFVDSDDYLSVFFVEKVLGALLREQADIAQCDLYKFCEGDDICNDETVSEIRVFSREEILDDFFHQGVTRRDIASRIIKRSFFDNYRMPQGRQIIDVITSPMLLNQCKKYVYLTGKLYYNYQNPVSMSHGVFTEQRWNDYIYSKEFFEKFITEECPEFKDFISYRIVKSSIGYSIGIGRNQNMSNKKEKKAFLYNDFKEAYNDFKKSSYYDGVGGPFKIQAFIYRWTPGLYCYFFEKISPSLKKLLQNGKSQKINNMSSEVVKSSLQKQTGFGLMLSRVKIFFNLWRNYGFKVANNEFSFVRSRWRDPERYGNSFQSVRKYYTIIKFLNDKYGKIVEKYEKLTPKEWNGEMIEDNCPVWIWWEQGYDNLPLVVRGCVASLNKWGGVNHTVNMLDRNNISQFIDIPEKIWEKKDKRIINSSNLSDLIRFMLLEKYGGVWVDACDFFVGDGFFKEMTKYPFYSAKGFNVKLNITRRLWSDGLFACGLNNAYPKVMVELLTAYFLEENYAIDYFVSSCFQNVVYERVPSMRLMMNNYPCNTTHFYRIRWRFGEKFNEAQWKEYREDTDVFNLTWKIDFKPSEETYYAKLISTLAE